MRTAANRSGQTLKRAYRGINLRIEFKHLQRYLNGFPGRHNIRHKDTVKHMWLLAECWVRKPLRYGI